MVYLLLVEVELLIVVIFFCCVCVKIYCCVCFCRFSNCCFCVLREGIDELFVEIGEFVVLEEEVIEGVDVLEIGEVLVDKFLVFLLLILV